MRFAEPEWLLFGLAALVLAAVAAAHGRRVRRRLEAHVDPELFAAMTEAHDARRTRRRQWWLGLSALILCAVALARPQYGHRTEVRKGKGIELVVALDLSRSMLAEDVEPNRLARARLELEDLLRSLEGHRVGLVGFTSVGIPLTPLTVDRSAVRLQLGRVDPSVMPRGGTSIARAIEASRGLIEAGQTPGAGHAIVVVTDGEDHDGRAAAAAQAAQSIGIDVHVVGIGSTEGQPIPIYEDGVRRGYVEDARGRTVLTRLEPETLRQIAESGGGVAALPSPGAGGIDFGPLRAHLAGLDQAELQARTVRVYEERYRWFAWPALVLLFIATVWSVRRPASAALTLALAGLGPSSAIAQTPLETPEPGVEAAIEHLQAGDAEAAEQQLDALIRRDGPSPELSFNRGLARAAQERWDEAIEDFGRAASEAPTDALRGRAHFARGNAHRRAGRLDEAIADYRRALLADPSLEGARQNLEVARAMKALAPPPPPSSGGEGGESQDDGADGAESEASGDDPERGDQDETGAEDGSDDPRDGEGASDPSPDEPPDEAGAPSPQDEAGTSEAQDGAGPDQDGLPSDPNPGDDGPEPGEAPGEEGPPNDAKGRNQPGSDRSKGDPSPAEPGTAEGASPRPDDGAEPGARSAPPGGAGSPTGPSDRVPPDVAALLEALRQQERVLQRELLQRRHGGQRGRVEKDW